MRRFPLAFQLAVRINDEAAADDSVTGIDELGTTHLEGGLLLPSEKQDAPLYSEAAAVHVKNITKQNEIPRFLVLALLICVYHH